MANRLNVANIGYDDNNDALTIASDGTISAGTLGSGVTFPAGHVIQTQILQWDENSTHIVTSSTSYSNIGIAGSFQTLKSSSESFLMFELCSGMTHVTDSTATIETDFCLTSSDVTTHFNANSLSDVTYRNFYQPKVQGVYTPKIFKSFFKSGTRTTTNLSSYSAGDTIYLRIFSKVTAGGWYMVHSGANYYLLMKEIAL